MSQHVCKWSVSGVQHEHLRSWRFNTNLWEQLNGFRKPDTVSNNSCARYSAWQEATVKWVLEQTSYLIASLYPFQLFPIPRKSMRILNGENVWPAIPVAIVWKMDKECYIKDLCSAGEQWTSSGWLKRNYVSEYMKRAEARDRVSELIQPWGFWSWVWSDNAVKWMLCHDLLCVRLLFTFIIIN